MAAPKRLAAVPPTEQNVRRVNRNAKVFAPLTRLMMRPRWSIDVQGRENVPREGAVLVLSNHVGFFDPAQLIIAARRNIHFMATQATMTDPVLGRVMRLFGAVPKQKGVADPKAIQGMREWTKLGAAVGLFPEGERTWDGRPLPILPGIERLVRLLRVPVVTARIENADHVTPRWADRPRRGRLRVSFDPPREFDRKTKLPVIREFIESRLAVDPATAKRWPVKGKFLARGLANLLYRCPDCERLEGLREEDEHVQCRHCDQRWRVTADGHLESTSDRRPIWSITSQIEAANEREWSAALDEDPAALLARSVDAVELIEHEGDSGTYVATGRLEIDGNGVRVCLGHERPLDVPTAELAAMTVEFARRLQLVTRSGRLFEFQIPRESVIKFKAAGDLLLRRREAAKSA